MHAARGHARTKKSGPVHGRSSLGRGVRRPRRARWASLDGGDPRSKPQVCHCGAPNCKGFIGESDDAQGESAEVTHIPEFPLVTTAPATAADGAPSTTPVPSGKVGTLPGPPRPTGAVIPRLPPPPSVLFQARSRVGVVVVSRVGVVGVTDTWLTVRQRSLASVDDLDAFLDTLLTAVNQDTILHALHRLEVRPDGACARATSLLLTWRRRALDKSWCAQADDQRTDSFARVCGPTGPEDPARGDDASH